MTSFKSQFYGKEGKFAIVAGVALLVAMVLPFTGAWYVGIATVSLSAICAIALALFRVRLWVRLITMPLVMLAAFILVMSACDMWLDGTSTSWGDPDYDARYFGSQLLMKCPMFGRVTQTQEGQKAKADYERWGDRIDDLTILPWRSYEKRYRSGIWLYCARSDYVASHWVGVLGNDSRSETQTRCVSGGGGLGSCNPCLALD